jgi:hypothetical protein
MGRFYETTFYDEEPMVVGWHVLASPANIGRESPSYSSLFDRQDLVEVSLTDRKQLEDLVGLIGDTTMVWNDSNIDQLLRGELNSEINHKRLDDLMSLKTFAVEASPLDGKSIYDIIAVADSCHLIVINAKPALVFMGKHLGIVVFSCVSLVGVGLGKSISDFGYDFGTRYLNVLREKLDIPARKNDKE